MGIIPSRLFSMSREAVSYPETSVLGIDEVARGGSASPVVKAEDRRSDEAVVG